MSDEAYLVRVKFGREYVSCVRCKKEWFSLEDALSHYCIAPQVWKKGVIK